LGNQIWLGNDNPRALHSDTPPGRRGGMTIRERSVDSAEEALHELEALAARSEDVVFRGHSQQEWRIESTLQRHSAIPHQSWDERIDDMLLHFMVNLSAIGQFPEAITRDRRARLEYEHPPRSWQPVVGIGGLCRTGWRVDTASQQECF
jgi:hypothetical protein